LTSKEIIEIFKAEGLCKKMSETTVYNARQKLNGRKLELMRKKENREVFESFKLVR